MITTSKNFISSILYKLKLLRLKLSIVRFSKISPLVKSDFSNNNISCVVLGNGPSLKNDITKVLELKNVDFFCVNHMAEAEYFQILKPNKYAFIDAYFWAKDAHDSLIIKRQLLFNALNKKVDWNMLVYVPRNADIDYIKKMITNSNIQVIQLAIIPLPEITYKNTADLLLKGVFGPPACNVVIYAMYLSIMAGYKYIDLYGADLSFTEDVIVDQKSNALQIEYKHFYGESTFEPLLQNPQRITPFTMEALYKITYLTFSAHNVLNKMALINNIKIMNQSSYSIIDAYERG